MSSTEEQLLAQARESYSQARARATPFETLDLAIDGFRDVAATFESLNQPLAAAVALIDLGAQLINRAWTPPNLVNLSDAVEAEQVLSRALALLSHITDPITSSLEANAHAWRARARTFLAERDLSKNELAIQDANQAIQILDSQPTEKINRHDLAIAHLHLARAYFFRVAAMKSFWHLLSGKRRGDIRDVHHHAEEALRLDGGDHHIQVQGSWLLQNVDTL